jgi:DNA polymerase-3 subunit gamma/tau
VKILSRREQFEQMAEKNAAVAKLQQAFDLELA